MENIPESLSFDSEFKIPGMENDQENEGGFTKENLMNWTTAANSNGTTNQEDNSGFGRMEQKLDESVTEMKRQMWSAMLGPEVESKEQMEMPKSDVSNQDETISSTNGTDEKTQPSTSGKKRSSSRSVDSKGKEEGEEDDGDDEEEDEDDEEDDDDSDECLTVSSGDESDDEDVEEVDKPASKKGDETAEVIDDDEGDDDVLMTSTEPAAKSDNSVINVSSADSVTFKVGDDDTSDTPVVVGEQKAKKPPAKRKRARPRKPKTATDGEEAIEISEDGEPKPKTKRKRKRRKGQDGEKEKGKKKRKKSFERRNIRKIMSEEKLTEETLKAQEEEKERQRWLQEQRERMAEQQRQEAENKKSELKLLLEADDSTDSEQKDGAALLAKVKEAKESGGDDSDDSDIIILPDEPEPQQEEEEDDYNNSGSHVNDDMNQPDSEGRVLVNVGHPPNEPDIFLAPQLAYVVKPHQIGGIRFLYDNLVESVERYKVSNGFGCILAHSMGLGKTLQLISFIDVFLRNTNGRTVLAIVPVNTLQNWLAEFNMWLPNGADPRLKDVPEGAVLPRQFNVYSVNDNHKNNNARAKVVAEWYKNGGVLLMGYEMYRMLTNKRVSAPARSRKSKKVEVIDIEEEEKAKELLQGMHGSLVRPGPDLVICDEGHRIKNSHASISQSLKNIRTRRRVVLTGYPLQNNLLEYWCMVDFVRPNFLGTKTEFCNMFERPIMNGQCQDSTPQDVRLMRFRAHVLHSLLEGFVQRRGHTVLRASLPDKEEHVILVKMSPIQRRLYAEFIESLKEEHLEGWANSNPLKAFAVCCKIWNHPDVLYKIVQKKSDDNDLDLDPNEDSNGSKKKGKGKSFGGANGTLSASSSCSSLNSMASMGSSSSMSSNLGGGMTRPNSMSAMTPSDSINSMGRTDSMSSLVGRMDSMGRTDSMNSLGRSDPLSSLGRMDNMARSDSMSNMGRTDNLGRGETVKYGSPMLPSFMQEDTFNPNERDKQVITYEWADPIMKDYIPGVLENGGKMQILFTLIDESIRLGDKILVFSQSLLTLNLMEELLAKRDVPGTDEKWTKNKNYYRLDGSTSGQDREKLINQFNDPENFKIKLFMLSTRAGCLGVNLVGANRVVVFDASWNPCHDAQAVCRVYRYGQVKQCQIYRLVTDNTMEKKIYDRQINKQGVADRVVDEMQPKNLFTRKQQDTLLLFSDEEAPNIKPEVAEGYDDELLQRLIRHHHNIITKDPFTHESLLIDDKAGKLTRQEKRLAKQGYEMEKKLNISYTRPSYANFYPKADCPGFPRSSVAALAMSRPVASVRPMMSNPPPIIRTVHPRPGGGATSSLPISSLLRPGVSVHQVKTTTDIVIPGTNTATQSTGGGGRNKIPAGETVLVIKTPKGMYIRTNQGRIFCVRSTGATTPPGGQNNEAGNQGGSNTTNPPSNDPSNTGKIFSVKTRTGDAGCTTTVVSTTGGSTSVSSLVSSAAESEVGTSSVSSSANTTTTTTTTSITSANDSRGASSLNQLLDTATGNTGNQQTEGEDRTATENNIHSMSRGSEEIGSLQSLMERSESFLGQMEGRSTGSSGSGSRGQFGEGSPAPRPSPAVERSMTSPEGESDDSDISIVGETPGNGSSALDSLGNFSLNSLLGGGGGSSDIGRSDSPLGRGSPLHHRGSASASSSSSSASVSSSSHRAYPPSASYGSMASMAHHMMTPPPYMTPGWGFPVWNPAGMSVQLPPSGPSIQHSDHGSHHSTQHNRSQHHHSSSSRSSRDGSKSDTLSLSDNRTKHDEDKLRESDSPGRGSRGSPSIHSLPSATSTGMPPFMGLPYGMPYSYPAYSYPYLPPPGIHPPPPAHSHSSSDSSSPLRGGYYPHLPPYPGPSYPGAAHLTPSSGGGWSGLSSSTGNPMDDNTGKSDD